MSKSDKRNLNPMTSHSNFPNCKFSHNCICEEKHSRVYATMKNMRLHCRLNMNVTEGVKINVPVKKVVVCKSPMYQTVRQPSSSESEYETVTKVVKVRKSKSRKSSSSSSSSDDAKLIKTTRTSTTRTGSVVTWFVNISVTNLPRMDGLLSGGACDPYFQLFLDDECVYGEKSLAIKNSRNGSWDFRLPADLIRNSKMIKINWFDMDKTGKDDYIGTSKISTSQALRSILVGTSNECKTSSISIEGKKTKDSYVSLTFRK